MSERENKRVSQVSMVNSRTPTPSTSTSPIMRAITSPAGVLSSRAIGQAMTPRHASARILARIRAFAVISHQRLAMRGTSVSSVPPTKARAAQPTAPGAHGTPFKRQRRIDSLAQQDRRQHNGGVHDDPGYGAEHELPRHLPEVRAYLPEIITASTIGPSPLWSRMRRHARHGRLTSKSLADRATAPVPGACVSGRVASAAISLSTRAARHAAINASVTGVSSP